MRAGLVALILAAAAAPAPAAPRVELAGRFVWERPERYFGGWSGIEVADGGQTFFAIGDNAQTCDCRFTRDAAGRITGIPRKPIGALTDTDGVALFRKHAPGLTDSEGLARLPDGSYAVSFEKVPRVLLYPPGGGPPVRLPDMPGITALPPNQMVEALAADAKGRLLAIPEVRPPGDAGFPVWRLEGAAWKELWQIATSDGFHPTGADVGPDGKLYLLERDYWLNQFRSRIRVFDPEAPDPQGVTLWQSGYGAFDNLEGISVWRDRAGGTRITMISDDNYKWYQRTEIIELALTG